MAEKKNGKKAAVADGGETKEKKEAKNGETSEPAKKTEKSKPEKAVKAKEKNTKNTDTAEEDVKQGKEPWHKPEEYAPHDNTVRLLNIVSSNARMAKMAIESILPQVSNEKLKHMLKDDIAKYTSFIEKITVVAENCKLELPLPGALGKFLLNSNIKVKLFFNSEATRIAELLILENTAGVIEIGRGIKHITPVCEESRELATELLLFEEDRIHKLKYYL